MPVFCAHNFPDGDLGFFSTFRDTSANILVAAMSTEISANQVKNGGNTFIYASGFSSNYPGNILELLHGQFLAQAALVAA